MYKRCLQSFLSNYASNEPFRGRIGKNRDEVLKALKCPDSRYWITDQDDLELPGLSDDETELREGQFACSNCARKGKYARNTTHIELQTRSADEPTTIILNCNSCRKTYRFSS